jgi:hypothetical protein
MSLAPQMVTAASAASGLNPFAVGGVVLALLTLSVVVLLIFGAGREHS